MYGREYMNEKENGVLSQLKNNIKILIENNNLVVAKELLEQYKNIVPGDIEIYSIEAVILIQENRYYEALDLLHEGLELNSRNFDLLYNIAYIYEQIGQYAEAMDFYEEAVKLTPDEEFKTHLNKKIEELFEGYKELIEEKYNREERIKKSVENDGENNELLSIIVMDIINDIEEQFPVEQWLIENVHIWSVIRSTLFGMTAEKTHKRISNSKSTEKNLICEIKSKKDVSWLKNKVDAVFLSRAGFRSSIDGIWYSRFCDPLVDELKSMNLKTLSLDYLIGDNEYRYPEYKQSIHIQNHLNYVLSRNNENENIEYNLVGFKAFLYKLKTLKIKTKLNVPSFSFESVINDYILIRRWSDYFKMIFLNVKPKIGFVSVYQNHIGYAFCLACRECGVVSVDIQHGLHFENPVYVRWNKIPKNGYELVPNYFWCFDKMYVDMIKNWTKNISEIHNAVDGGNTWIEMCLKDDKKLLKNIDIDVKEKLSWMLSKTNCVNILYTHTSPGKIPDIVLKAIKSSPDNWNWLIRFHPMTPQDDKNRDINLLKSIGNSNIEYKFSTELPLLGLLSLSDVNVTLGSSTTEEATHFGVPTILLDSNPYFRRLYKSAFNSGLAKVANSTDSLLSVINEEVGKREGINSSIAKPKIKVALEEIIKFSKNNAMLNVNKQKNGRNKEYKELAFEINILDDYEQIELCLKYEQLEKLKAYYLSINDFKEREILRNYLAQKIKDSEVKNCSKIMKMFN